MGSDTLPPGPEQVLRDAGLALGEAILDVLPSWAERVSTLLAGASFAEPGRRAGGTMVTALAPALAALLAADVDAQRTTPLALLRGSMGPLSEVLRSGGVGRATRDELDRAMAPGDEFGVAPRTWADLGEEVHEAGIRWGVAKAFAHRARHGGGTSPRRPG